MDVVMRDFGLVAGNARRVDRGVVEMHRNLEQSGFAPVASHARQVTAAFAEMACTGLHGDGKTAVENEKGVQEIVERLEA